MKISMKRYRDHKGTVRFQADDPKAAIRDVYVSRELAGVNTATEITVTIEVGGATAAKTPVSDDALLAALK